MWSLIVVRAARRGGTAMLDPNSLAFAAEGVQHGKDEYGDDWRRAERKYRVALCSCTMSRARVIIAVLIIISDTARSPSRSELKASCRNGSDLRFVLRLTSVVPDLTGQSRSPWRLSPKSRCAATTATQFRFSDPFVECSRVASTTLPLLQISCTVALPRNTSEQDDSGATVGAPSKRVSLSRVAQASRVLAKSQRSKRPSRHLLRV